MQRPDYSAPSACCVEVWLIIVLGIAPSSASTFGTAFFPFCFVHRSSGLGTGREGGHPTGASPGGTEDICKEEEASQTPHVPQDAYEDH